MRAGLLAAPLALAFAACGTTPPDHTTVIGTNAFTAASTVMVSGGLHCSKRGVLTSGNFDALTVVVADVDLISTGCPHHDFDYVPHVLQLEVATGDYFTADPSTASQAITAGMTFPILNEDVSDEDLCGNVPAGTDQPAGVAMLHQCVESACKDYFASTGSITVAEVSSSSVAGTFDLTLVNNDHEPQGSLSGTFAAPACP